MRSGAWMASIRLEVRLVSETELRFVVEGKLGLVHRRAKIGSQKPRISKSGHSIRDIAPQAGDCGY